MLARGHDQHARTGHEDEVRLDGVVPVHDSQRVAHRQAVCGDHGVQLELAVAGPAGRFQVVQHRLGVGAHKHVHLRQSSLEGRGGWIGSGWVCGQPSQRRCERPSEARPSLALFPCQSLGRVHGVRLVPIPARTARMQQARTAQQAQDAQGDVASSPRQRRSSPSLLSYLLDFVDCKPLQRVIKHGRVHQGQQDLGALQGHGAQPLRRGARQGAVGSSTASSRAPGMPGPPHRPSMQAGIPLPRHVSVSPGSQTAPA